MNNKENETSIRKAPGFAAWPFNDIMMETSKGEYRKQWRFIGLTYLIYVVCITILDRGINHFFEKSIASGSIIPVLAGYITAALVCVPFIVIIGKRTRKSLGIQNENIAGNEFSGWIAAGLVLLMVLGINLLLGGLEIKLNPNINILMLLFMFIGFLLQGFMEEFLLRSLIMTQFSLRLGVVIGILLNSFILR